MPLLCTTLNLGSPENHPGTNSIVGFTINNDEGTRIPVSPVCIEDDGLMNRESTAAYFIEAKTVALLSMESIHIDTVA